MFLFRNPLLTVWVTTTVLNTNLPVIHIMLTDAVGDMVKTKKAHFLLRLSGYDTG